MRFPFRKTRASSRIALSRVGNTVLAVSVTVENPKPRVVSYAQHDLTESSPRAWSELIQALHLKREHVILVLSAGEYQLLQVESPNVPESERKQAVVWKLKDVLGYPVDQATVDAIAIPQDAGYPGRGGLMYAVAARNEIIQRYMESFESAGALLDVIDIPELAQRNMAALLEEAGRGIALLSFNEDGGLLTFTAGGELYHARSIEISTHQLSGMDAEQRRYVFERLVLELQRSLDNFERQFSYVTISKLVLAPMPGQAVLEEYLRENLGVTVISLDLAEVMNIAAIEELQAPAAQSQCFLALGAALRPAEATT